MKKIIEVKNLSKSINGRMLLNDINFDVNEGDIVGLVGKNGAGKSTLLKCMVGLYKMDKGDIFYNGISLKDNYEESISYVGCSIEQTQMYKELTGQTNYEIFKRMFKGVDDETIKGIVRIANMEKYLGSKFKTYSLGMKERMGVSCALMNNPHILILDEPTNGLDPIGIKKLRELLLSLKDTTIIISSHMLSEIEAICDVVLFIDSGKIVSKKLIEKNSNKKYIEFEVDDYSKTKVILNNYNVCEELCVYESDEIISKINEELVNNNIKVYRIFEQTNLVTKEFLSISGEE